MSEDRKESRLGELIRSKNKFAVVGVGASAGGLAAFKEFSAAIPEESGMAYVFVQHLDPDHESLLPELLQKSTKLPVSEISDEVEVHPNNIYIIPRNKMLMSNDGRLELSPRPDKRRKLPNLPIDLFFESLAEVHQSHSIGVVLSGNGSDGTKGLESIKNLGGFTFAQDESTTNFPSMPRSAIENGVVDYVLPPQDIPGKILEIIRNCYGDEGDEKKENENSEVYKQILAVLRVRKGSDFTFYKQTTIRRRILRRIALSNKGNPKDYLVFLRENTSEQDILHQDLLIPVTDFFRDEDIFGNLCNSIFPKVIENNGGEEPIRIWAAGCSTGQEAYSIAMCLLECLENSQSSAKIQIFGTDISEKAISKARSGIYTSSEVENLAPNYVERFFSKIDGNYQIKKEVREMCVFAFHNFLKDPPFGKMDIITCRNVLIYLQPYLQKKALTTFHYALKKEGHLLLGKSETTAHAPNLFIQTDKKHKIFSPKDKPRKFMQVASQKKEENYKQFSKPVTSENARTDFQRSADEIILSRYTPAGVVIDEAMEIVHFRGRTGSFLEPQAGKPSLNLLKMAKPGLAFELRSIVHHAKKEGGTVVKENIPIQEDGNQRNISIEAIPLLNLAESYYLILFHDPSVHSLILGVQKEDLPISSKKGKEDEKDLLIKQLERELAQAREDMRSITEDQEATNEELQSANEELQSGSEELQTLNEELETSKEELQSTNEELISVNQELLSMNKNLTTAKNFAVDILETIREPWVVLDKQLRVKSGNNVFYKVFRTSEREMENRSILKLGDKEWQMPELEELLKKVLSEKTNFSNYEITQDFPVIGERTMLLNAREVVREEGGEKLILLVFGDITDKRIAEKSLEKSEIKFKLLAETIPQLIWINNEGGEFLYFNSKWKQYTGTSSNESLGNKWISFVHPNDLSAVLDNWNESLRTGKPFSMEYRLKSTDGTYNWFLAQALPLYNTDGKIIKWFGSYTNIELQKEAENSLRRSREHFRDLAQLIPEKISYADAQGNMEYYNKSWLDYTGMDQEELKGKGWLKTIHPKYQEAVLEKWKACIKSETDFEIEVQFRNKNGEYKWHLSRAIPIKDDSGAVKQWIGATTEIEKIKEEEKRKEGFLQLVSHELKTPITSIKGYVQLLLNMLQEENKDNIESLPLKPSLRRIDDQLSRLTRLISEMLDISRIEENKLKLKKEVFSLNEFVEETIQDINRTEIDHHIIIHHHFKCEVEADKDRIGQVIINLLTNAIKYAPGQKEIEVSIFETDDHKAAISVKDKGIGIAKEDQREVFKRFHRVAGKNEETYAGLGIGLYLAHEIAERHGGAIYLESKLGEGSTFTFTLPCKTIK